MHRTATISIFLSVATCGSICRAQTCAHSGIYKNRQYKPRRFYRVGQKVRKSFKLFTTPRPYVHRSQKRLQIEAYKQRIEKKLYLSPIHLSHVYGPIAHGVLQVEPKSELRNTSLAAYAYSNSAGCRLFSLASRMYGTDLRTFWCRTVKIGQGVSTGWVKKFEKISNFSPFRHFTSLYL